MQLSQIDGPSEQDEKAPGPFLPPDGRVGFSIVGLGRLSVNQILPAFGHSQYCKPVALVSGDRNKASKVAAQYGIAASAIYDFANFDQLARNPEVKVIYLVLLNGMHEEYVTRGAKAGKQILCEKPMATSSREAERMISECKGAKVKLMIAYRQQYEPHNHALRQLVTEGKLGALRGFVSSNSQQQGDPTQWRLKKSLSGGGCLPDVGLYCLNASRFLSGEEPTDVSAKIFQPKDDPRFTEVEASCSFSLKFPSGYVATCTTSYDVHKSQFLRSRRQSVGLYVPRLCHAGLLLLQPKISVAPKTKTMINRIAQKNWPSSQVPPETSSVLLRLPCHDRLDNLALLPDTQRPLGTQKSAGAVSVTVKGASLHLYSRILGKPGRDPR